MHQWRTLSIARCSHPRTRRKTILTPARQAIKGFLLSYERELRDNPRFLLPHAPAFFEKTVAACERIAKEFSGRLKAKIDYSFFTTIEVWCCYVEFQREEFMSILREISNHAISVRFTPLTSGDLHIEIVMPYFASMQQEKDIC